MTDPVQICIVEKNSLVANDIAESVAEFVPGAVCSAFSSIEEARQMSEDAARFDVLLIAANCDGALSASDTDLRWVAARRVVAVDLSGPERHPAWQHLTKPFTQGDLERSVMALLRDRPVSGGVQSRPELCGC